MMVILAAPAAATALSAAEELPSREPLGETARKGRDRLLLKGI